MRVRRLAYPLFGLWAALALAACVLQAGGSDAIDAFLTPALGVLAGVGALLSRAAAGEPDRADPARPRAGGRGVGRR